jgi:DNA-directed RNA polymerase subunit M/transcription elongation factor TFIIS
MKFITVKESNNISDLLVLKSKLESEGINCRIKDELSSQVLNYLPSMSAKLQVVEDDIEKVIEIIKESGEIKTETKTPFCPNCRSKKLEVKLNLYFILNFLLSLIIAVLTFRSIDSISKSIQYKCTDCATRFKFNE